MPKSLARDRAVRRDRTRPGRPLRRGRLTNGFWKRHFLAYGSLRSRPPGSPVARPRVERLAPGDETLIGAARLYRRFREPGHALALLEAAGRRRPRDSRVKIEAAELLEEMGERARALDALARVEAMDPGADEKRRATALRARRARAEALKLNRYRRMSQ